MSENSSHPAETPLESWKAIAAHLQRDISTVKRWESSENLPVHRHHHLARSSVYAYPSELDAWRANRQPEKDVPVATSWFGGRTRALALASLTMLTLVSSGGGRVIGPVSTAAQDRNMTARQVWAGPDVVDVWGSVSPDGRYLSFVDWGTGDLALRDLRTKQSRPTGPVPMACGRSA